MSHVKAVTITLPDQREGVVVVGGIANDNWSQEMWLYDCKSGLFDSAGFCQWVKMNQTLPDTRHSHVAMIVPNNMTQCTEPNGANQIVNKIVWMVSITLLFQFGNDVQN